MIDINLDFIAGFFGAGILFLTITIQIILISREEENKYGKKC